MKNTISLRPIALLLLVSGAVFSAGDPAGFHIWKAKDIEAQSKLLAAKLDATHVASETLATAGNRTFMVAHREGVGQVEWHDKQADVLVIESGAATVILGGEVVGGKTTAPGEIRGTSIKGGTETQVGPGDVIHIPAKTAHQMKTAPGKALTYFVIKVTE